MIITQTIKIDFTRPAVPECVSAVQGEDGTRVVRIELYAAGAPWQLPAGHDVSIRYGKPDGTNGSYDTLPDKSAAWSSEGNTVSVILCPQMLTCPGTVHAQVCITVGERLLSTFAFYVVVEADPSKGAVKSENYHNWRKAFLPQTEGAKVGQYLQITEVDAEGRVIKVEPVDAPSGGYGGGDLDMKGKMIDNIGTLAFAGPDGAAADGAWMAIETVAENEDGVRYPILNHYSNDQDAAVVYRNIAPGVEDRDAVNVGQLKTRLLAPIKAAVGQYIRITGVDKNGAVTAVEAVDAPSGGDSSGATVGNVNFKGRTLLVTGDSITEKNFRATVNWHDYLKEWCGFSGVKNDGVSGSGLLKNNGIIYRIPSWDAKYGDFDIILIMGNMNDGTTGDYATSDWLGNFDDDPSAPENSLYAALHHTAQSLIDKYPNKPIGWIISTPRSQIGDQGKCWGVDGWFEDWVTAIKKVCAHYSIPVLDLYHESGLRPWNSANNSMYFSCSASPYGDGIHPNDKGQELMAKTIYPWVNQHMVPNFIATTGDGTDTHIAVTGITITGASTELTAGDKLTLRANVVPSNATNKLVTWSVSNDNVSLSVDTETHGAKCVVTGVKSGDCTITATTDDGGFVATYQVSISVNFDDTINLFNPDDVDNGKIVNGADGGLIENSYYPYIVSSGLTPVKPNTRYILSHDAPSNLISIYDATGAFVRALEGVTGATSVDEFQFTTGSGEHYVRFNINTNLISINDVYLYEETGDDVLPDDTINLFSPDDVDNSKLLRGDDGELIANSSYPYIVVSGLISVKPNTRYILSHNSPFDLMCAYDASGAFVRRFDGFSGVTSVDEFQFTTGSGEHYVRFNINTNLISIEEVYLYEKTE